MQMSPGSAIPFSFWETAIQTMKQIAGIVDRSGVKHNQLKFNIYYSIEVEGSGIAIASMLPDETP